MSLTDPRPALAEASFIDYLVGLAGLGQLVHTLAAETGSTAATADDFVYLLLGLAGVADRVEQLATSVTATPTPSGAAGSTDSGRWLR